MNRRSLITGLISLVAAPAIVRAGSLMPVKNMIVPVFDADEITFSSQPTAEWSAGFCVNGRAFSLGDFFEMAGIRFRVTGVSEYDGGWSYVHGSNHGKD